MLRLRKVKMPDDSTMFSCKVTLEATCEADGLDEMLEKIASDVRMRLGILAMNIEHCDEARIDSAGQLHTKIEDPCDEAKTGAVQDDGAD